MKQSNVIDGEIYGPDEEPLTALDRAVIGWWRSLGYIIPAPELSLEARDDLCRELGEALQNFDDRLFCKG